MSATWKVTAVEKKTKLPKDGICEIHWECVDSVEVAETTHSGRMWGSVRFSPNASKEGYVKFSDVTEEIAISWVKDSESIDVDEIEASVANQIEESKSPLTVFDTPWS
tara:strand:+ start:1693 stop:2016 length:324 start_codon:yes stop_codon:yes gene_type:complete